MLVNPFLASVYLASAYAADALVSVEHRGALQRRKGLALLWRGDVH
jgi:hypothetical protein